MRQFFTKISLTIAVFSLFIGLAGVAYGAEEPAEVSGVCSVRNTFVNAPTFYLPDVGVGYAKKAIPGVNTISELRRACTAEIYQELLRRYCAQNSKPPGRGVITYKEDGKIDSVASSVFGSVPVNCPAPDVPFPIDSFPIRSLGNCGNREECQNYCSIPANFDKCLEFATLSNLPVEEVPIDEEVSTVSFPIPELGNCGSEKECHDYCEDLEHASACIAYARANNLLSEEEEKTLEEFSDVIENGGPGGCKTEESCGAYCEDTANLKECLGFVKKHKLLTDDEIKEVEEVVEAIEKGDAPGGCKDEISCQNYCEDTDNVGECADFADEFDLVTSDELEEMRKMAAAKEAGVSFPGNCADKESCLQYCDNSAHQLECIEFAQAAGLIKEEDNEAISKIIPYLKQGGKLPGGCTTKESCDAYCESDSNTNECMDFAVEAGFMNKEEADIIKKVGGKGPGNCKSREACDNYCKNEEHVDECIEFGVRAGFISPEDAEMAKKFGISSGPGDCKSKTECQSFCTLSENQQTCSNWAKEHGMDTGGPDGADGGAGFSGPGGCKNKEECTVYCTANQEDEECKKMIQDYGGQGEPGGQAGPGGDQSQIPQGYSSWQEFCMAQVGDPRCSAYNPQAPPSGDSGPPQGDGGQSQIPQGYSSWEEFCRAQPNDSRCTAYKPQTSPSGGGGDQSGIPQGYSSWSEFCQANYSDSRCTQPQQYPLLLQYQPFAAILNFLFGR
ncbi:MAG: hypothetical protein G01um101444_260 [Parcubacteria group bacterium Gr01-1014_44]|nr:MAG: hypothetical protein G01um101444_260 [Parcubacteria group bacterium Gr01-1014_44]